MNRLIVFFILGASLFLLTACPIGLDYALGKSGEEKNDSKLYGTWEIDDPEETILSFSISKKTENTMHVEVLSNSEMFTPATTKFTGWIVSLGGMRFLCLSENAEPNLFYHYVIVDVNDNDLKVCALSLLHEGIDAVKSQETLRNEVLASIKKPGFTESPLVYKRSK